MNFSNGNGNGFKTVEPPVLGNNGEEIVGVKNLNGLIVLTRKGKIGKAPGDIVVSNGNELNRLRSLVGRGKKLSISNGGGR